MAKLRLLKTLPPHLTGFSEVADSVDCFHNFSFAAPETRGGIKQKT
jgi:hypothetical protein